MGDLAIFEVPASLPDTDITIKINDAPARFFRAEDNQRVQGANLVAGTKHLISRSATVYHLIGGETEHWALFGNTDAIPNSKIDGLLAQVIGWHESNHRPDHVRRDHAECYGWWWHRRHHTGIVTASSCWRTTRWCCYSAMKSRLSLEL